MHVMIGMRVVGGEGEERRERPLELLVHLIEQKCEKLHGVVLLTAAKHGLRYLDHPNEIDGSDGRDALLLRSVVVVVFVVVVVVVLVIVTMTSVRGAYLGWSLPHITHESHVSHGQCVLDTSTAGV